MLRVLKFSTFLIQDAAYLKITKNGLTSTARSTTAEVVLEKVVGEGKQADRANGFALFPWREASLPRSIFKTALNLASISVVSYMTAGATISGTKVNYKDFLLGGEKAFQCTSDSIFHHILMQKHRQQVKPSVSGTTPLETKDVANLDEVFGKELQAFYRHAIEQHCLKSSYYCTYALENIHKVYISRMEFIRGTVVDDENVPVTKWGTGLPGLSFLGPNDNDHTSFPKFEDIRSSLEKCFNMNESTVRVWMDIECTEIFAISDSVTGDAVQGSLQPRRVTHQILLENLFYVPEDRYLRDWTIVDLDNWLGENQFWVKDKLHPPSS